MPNRYDKITGWTIHCKLTQAWHKQSIMQRIKPLTVILSKENRLETQIEFTGAEVFSGHR